MALMPKQREAVYNLSTRISEDVMAILRNVTDTGVSQRDAVEYAIKHTYVKPTGESEDDLLQRQEESKAAYLTAVNELFRLLGLPAGEKSENHRELVAAANNACGAARVLMLKAWEGEDEPWQR